MIAPILALVLHTLDAKADLAAANAGLASVETYPHDSPRDCVGDALEKFEALEEIPRYARAAYAGAGKCLMMQGYFQDAAEAFHKAGSALEAQAKEADEVSDAIGELLPAKFVIDQLRQIPGSDTWVAMFGVSEDHARAPDDGLERLALYRYDPVRRKATQIGTAKETHDYFTSERCTLYLTHLTATDPNWHALALCEFYGDRVPVYVQLYDIRPKGLHFVQELQSTSGMSIYGPTRKSGLVVEGSLNWKLSWDDAFEWEGRGFFFANSRHPELFPLPESGSGGEVEADAWPDDLKNACSFAIHKRFSDAMKSLKLAARECVRRVHDNPDRLDFDEQFFGGPDGALPLIRRRIKWLRGRDYNHDLLYQPIDDDMLWTPIGGATGR